MAVSRLLTETTNLWKPVIGLEIHAQIATKSKLFSGASTRFAAPPNSQVACFDAATPGTLPVLNGRCVELGVKTGIALNCKVNLISYFDRKHYFYADLPAGYQITQQRRPIATDGRMIYYWLNPLDKQMVKSQASIIQVQLEQDSGKSLHDNKQNHSVIDLNRAGVGLLEIVTEPTFTSGVEAASFVSELRALLMAIGACNGNMAEGALRVDANVSVNKEGEPWGTRAEVKNLNSLRAVNKAVDFEIIRQITELEAGRAIVNETRSFDVETEQTVGMRDKEVVQDYRYMPEPNLPPLRLWQGCPGPCPPNGPPACVSCLARQLPVDLPPERRRRLHDILGLSYACGSVVLREDGLYEWLSGVLTQRFGEDTLVALDWVEEAAFWATGPLLGLLRKAELRPAEMRMSQTSFMEFIDMMVGDMLTQDTAKQVFTLIFEDSSKSALQITKEKNWFQVSDDSVIEETCQRIMAENPKAVADFKKGKKNVVNFIIRKVNAMESGRFNPEKLQKILTKLLEKG